MSTDRNDPEKYESIETDLIGRAKKHHPDAWRELLMLHGPLVDFWIGESNLHGPDRDDVFQEVFLTVARKIDDFMLNQSGSFRGWLRVITRSRVVDHFRRTGRCFPASGGDENWEQLLHLADSNDDDEVKDERTDESFLLLDPALNLIQKQVKPTTWIAFWESVVEERPVADVAKQLGVSPSAIRLAKSRVLKRIRELLEI